MTLCLGLALTAPGFGAICNSTGPGNFSTLSNWSCLAVPSIADDVTISHNMYSTSDVTVLSLNIAGGGTLEMQGFSLEVETPTLEVQPGGTLQGQSGVNGDNVYVTAPMGSLMTVINNGMIRGGSPGGSVFIHDGGSGGDLPCPTGSVIESNGGFFLGGAGGTSTSPASAGNVYLLAETVDLVGATVAGGSGFVPFNFLGNSIAGNVYIAGITVNIVGGSFITSGDNTNPAPGAIGGSVKIVAEACSGSATLGNLVIGPGSTVAVGTPSSSGCPGALVYASGTSTILGTVALGPAGCLYWDPPKLVLSGDAELTAGQVILAGSDLDATGLASRTLPTPAVDAADTLEINLNPGGTADFQGLTPGIVYFRAGSSIIIRADQVLTDPGVGLEDLMEPAPEIAHGTPTVMLDMTGDHQQFVSPGASVQYPVQVTNIGTVSAYFEVSIEDSQGWLAGGAQFISMPLDPGEAILRTLTIDVPRKASRSRSTTVTLTASIDGKPPQKSRAVFIMND